VSFRIDSNHLRQITARQRRDPFSAGWPSVQSGDAGTMTNGVWWGSEADAEIAIVASSATEWTYKENSVENAF
jgi:hypothetical protein